MAITVMAFHASVAITMADMYKSDSSIRWQPTTRGKHSVYMQVDILKCVSIKRKK